MRPSLYSVMSPLVVMRPIRPGLAGLGEPERAVGALRDAGGARVGRRPWLNSLNSPSGVMRPMAPGSPFSVNQRLPSGPAVMSVGAMFGVSPMLFSVMTPVGRDAADPARVRGLGEPEVAVGSGRDGARLAARREARAELGDSAVGVMRPMKAGDRLTNQRLPSGPAVMSQGSLGVRPASNSVTSPPLSPARSRRQSLTRRSRGCRPGPCVMPFGAPASGSGR